MDAKKLVKQYLEQVNIFQLATAVDNKPWGCNLHFYSNDKLELFWISTTERKHSLDIAANKHVAATVLVHQNTPEEDYVIGITIVGEAELLAEHVDRDTVEQYLAKQGKDQSMLASIEDGTSPHKFYRLRPTKVVLFDTLNFPDDPRQEIQNIS